MNNNDQFRFTHIQERIEYLNQRYEKLTPERREHEIEAMRELVDEITIERSRKIYEEKVESLLAELAKRK